MAVYESLAIALRGHYHKLIATIPPDIQQRILQDFAPWTWESKTPRQRCQRAKQWDYENDPARRELREGTEKLTNPDSPDYLEEEMRRLRGDYLSESRQLRPKAVDLPPLDFDASQPHNRRRASPASKESASAREGRLLKMFDEEVRDSGKHGALARVHARELIINPKADRSNIGKQIRKARTDATKAKRGAAMFDSLVRDRNRVK
jgi:hypothetical protein